jgi:hypothetical protein
MTRARDIADTQDNLGGAVAPFVAGKNVLINGAFDFWARGTSFSAPNNLYTADRFSCFVGGTGTLIRDTANVPEGITYAAKYTSSGANGQIQFLQTIETANAVQLANKTVTLSFWASGTLGETITTQLGYSTSTDASFQGAFTLQTGSARSLTTTPIRHSQTFTVDASAKTVQIRLISSLLQNTEFVAVTGVQLEIGSVATPFSRAGGSIGGELALCQRYYYRRNSDATGGVMTTGYAYSSTNTQQAAVHPVQMRTIPSITRSGLQITNAAGNRTNFTNITNSGTSTTVLSIITDGSTGLTAGSGSFLCGAGASTTDYVACDAEL